MPPQRRSPPWLDVRGSRRANAGAHASGARPRPARSTRPRAARQAVALSYNARVVLERRYLAKDARGRLTETPEGLFRRVARAVAAAEAAYAPPRRRAERVADYERRFYELMASLRFLPNSPTLGNAGRPLGQLSACFVLPVEDSIEGIFETLK